MNVNIFRIFQDAVTAVAVEVVGYRVHKGMKRGNAWWTGEIKKTIKGKRTHRGMLQRNETGEITERRNGYKSWNRKVKEVVKESKMKAGEEFGRKLSEKFSENLVNFFFFYMKGNCSRAKYKD